MPIIHTFSAEELFDVSAGNANATNRLDRKMQTAMPSDTVKLIDDYLLHYQKTNETLAEDAEEVAFELGCLWGTQLIEALAWHWIKVEFESGAFVIGVAPRDQSLVIYPFLSIFNAIEGRQPLPIDKSFRILTEPGRVPMLPPGGLENVMDHVH